MLAQIERGYLDEEIYTDMLQHIITTIADTGDAASGSDGWVPLWLVAVVAVAPGFITILLAWRAASSVEDAITIAAARRRIDTPEAWRAEHASE